MQNVELFFKKLRNRLKLNCRKTYVSIIDGASLMDENRKRVLFDFNSLHIDSDMARYLYQIVSEFEALGFQIVYSDNYSFLCNANLKCYKKYCFDTDYAIARKSNLKEKYEVVMTDYHLDCSDLIKKQVRVLYEARRAESENEVELPFSIHPSTDKNDAVGKFKFTPERDREIAILFAGNTSYPAYDKPIIKDTYKMLSRHAVIQRVQEKYQNLVIKPKSIDVILDDDYSKKIVLFTGKNQHIPNEEWLNVMGMTNFFLAPPGGDMPLCHNIIESLAAGTIPITQYQRYLTPELEDMKNCLVYEDTASLDQVIQKALALPVEEVIRMRKNAREYYERNCKRGKFATQIMEHESPSVALLFKAFKCPVA